MAAHSNSEEIFEISASMLEQDAKAVQAIEEIIKLTTDIRSTKKKDKPVLEQSEDEQIRREIDAINALLAELKDPNKISSLHAQLEKAEEERKNKDGDSEGSSDKVYSKKIIEPWQEQVRVTNKNFKSFKFKGVISGPKKEYEPFIEIILLQDRDHRYSIAKIQHSKVKSGVEFELELDLSTIQTDEGIGLHPSASYLFILKSEDETATAPNQKLYVRFINFDLASTQGVSPPPVTSGSIKKEILSPKSISVQEAQDKNYIVKIKISGPDPAYPAILVLIDQNNQNNQFAMKAKQVKANTSESIEINFAKASKISNLKTLISVPEGSYNLCLIMGQNDSDVVLIPVKITSKKTKTQTRKATSKISEEVKKWREEEGLDGRLSKDRYIKWHKENTLKRLKEIEAQFEKLGADHKKEIEATDEFGRLYEKDIQELKEVISLWENSKARTAKAKEADSKLRKTTINNYEDLFIIIKQLEELLEKLDDAVVSSNQGSKVEVNVTVNTNNGEPVVGEVKVKDNRRFNSDGSRRQ